MVTYASADDGGLQLAEMWPPDRADHPTERFDSPQYALAPDRTPGDRGHVVVTWDPIAFTGTVRYVQPLAVVRGLR